MNLVDFEAHLKAENYDQRVVWERLPGYALGEHQHAFDACGFITAGDFTLVVDGVTTNYAAGEVFRLSAGVPHHESVGSSGAHYVVGRRTVASA